MSAASSGTKSTPLSATENGTSSAARLRYDGHSITESESTRARVVWRAPEPARPHEHRCTRFAGRKRRKNVRFR